MITKLSNQIRANRKQQLSNFLNTNNARKHINNKNIALNRANKEPKKSVESIIADLKKQIEKSKKEAQIKKEAENRKAEQNQRNLNVQNLKGLYADNKKMMEKIERYRTAQKNGWFGKGNLYYNSINALKTNIEALEKKRAANQLEKNNKNNKNNNKNNKNNNKNNKNNNKNNTNNNKSETQNQRNLKVRNLKGLHAGNKEIMVKIERYRTAQKNGLFGTGKLYYNSINALKTNIESLEKKRAENNAAKAGKIKNVENLRNKYSSNENYKAIKKHINKFEKGGWRAPKTKEEVETQISKNRELAFEKRQKEAEKKAQEKK
ncbi:MAG: hypothetical protein Ct9H90mV1_1020 [Prasinovirus sp.]|nr:MAG: hypothetical protein Ct9H90mV1_1020 [Prasinovirus sp.]